MRARTGSIIWSGAVLAAVSVAGSGPTIASAAPGPGDDVQPEVIASGTVDFPGGTFHWRSFETVLPAVGAPVPAPEPFSIVYVTSGAVTVDDGSPFALPAGQAQMFERGPSPSLSGRGGATFRTLQIYNEADSEPVHATGDPFSVPRAPHEAELLRVDLAAGDRAVVPASGLPILVQAVEGGVAVSTGDEPVADGAAVLGADESDTFDGPVTIEAPDGPATALAVVLTGPGSTAVPGVPNAPERPQTLAVTITVEAPSTARPGQSVPIEVTVLPTGYEGVETELIVTAFPADYDPSGRVVCDLEDRRDLALPADRAVTIELNVAMLDVGTCQINASSGAQYVTGSAAPVTIDVSGDG